MPSAFDDRLAQADAAREQLVERFRQWLETHPEHQPADPMDADFVLDWKVRYADGDLNWWTRDHLDEVLLDHMPRKLTAAPEQVVEIPASIAAFMRFLGDADELGEASDPAERLSARALAQHRPFVDAMAEPSNFGMTKGLFNALGVTEDDLFSEDGELNREAVDTLMAEFNARPYEERSEILSGAEVVPFGGPTAREDMDDDGLEDLPPLSLRTLLEDDELVARYQDVPLAGKIDAFRAALGEKGIKLTKTGNPTLADGRRLVAAVGLDDNVEGIRSSAELRQLSAVALLAVGAGAARYVNSRLVPVAAWEQRGPVDRWNRLLDAALDHGLASLQLGGFEPMPLYLADLADEATWLLVASLWLATEPVEVDLLAEMFQAAALTDAGPFLPRYLQTPDRLQETSRHRVDDIVASLVDLGLVELDSGRATLTAAAPALLAGPLRDRGFKLISPGDLTGRPVGEVLDVVLDHGGLDPAEVAPLVVQGRTVEEVAGELIDDLCGDIESTRRMVGLTLLQALGPEAFAAVRPLLDDPTFGPYATAVLHEAGELTPEEVRPEAMLHFGVEVMMSVGDAGTPVDVVESFLSQVAREDQEDFIGTLASSDHPRTAELLELLGRHHPDPKIARHAHKQARRRLPTSRHHHRPHKKRN